MGTRSLINFVEIINGEPREIVRIYQQYDGYISGVGHELAAWLKNKKIINGIRAEQYDMKKYANGARCLAAEYIADHKTDVGGLYLGHYDFQDYNYTVFITDKRPSSGNEISGDDAIIIVVHKFQDVNNPIFIGSPSELLKFREE